MFRTAVITSAAALALAAASTVPAFAYDPQEYAYAAGHMITPKDVVKPLTVNSAGYFNAGPDGGSFLCRKDEKNVTVPRAKARYSINYDADDSKKPSVSVNVQQYSSSAKAISAYNALKKAAKTCAGPSGGSDSWPDADGNAVVEQWSALNTTGNVPLVTIVGVPSTFINTNYEQVISNQASRYSSDNYTVYTLMNDVIISTSFSSGSELNITAAQRKAVNKTAFNAVTAWLG